MGRVRGLGTMGTAENMGQTPVYDLSFATRAFIERNNSAPAYLSYRPIDCRDDSACQTETSDGHTFSRESSAENRVSFPGNPINTMDDAFSNSGKVFAYGRVCYRDIFRDIHSVRLCYEWTTPDYCPDKCQDENNEDRDY